MHRPPGNAILPLTLVLLASPLLPGCDSAPAAAPDGGGGMVDPGDGAVAGNCSLVPVLTLFATRCTNAACHGPNGQYPELTQKALPAWVKQMSRQVPSERLVVPGDPAASWLARKVSGAQGMAGGALMPLGASAPIAEASVIRDWIADGAPTECAGDGGAPANPSRPDPNSLDQAALFTCPSPAPAGSSVSRLRRIDQPEWTYAVSSPYAPTSWDATAYLNPFVNQTGAPYSTYSAGVTVDTATLDLYFLNLPEAAAAWDKQDTYALRIYPVYYDKKLRCIFDDVKPDAACIDYFVDRFLTLGVLTRAPTTDERSRFRAYLVAALGREPGGGDLKVRSETLDEAGEAAWLTTGALFRSEMGAPVMGDAAGRRRLTNDELALALGSVLSTHRPGSPMSLRYGYPPPAPDDVTPERGWLQLIRAAADDGTIQDPAVMRRLVAAYASGVDPKRRDLRYEQDERYMPTRGEYWLAPRIAGFFREWLDYGGAISAFKDTPHATSRFEGLDQDYAIEMGYTNLQDRYYGYESTMVNQLDDTIARVVFESAQSHGAVLPNLLTTRTWRLPSDMTDTNNQSCKTSADCKSPGVDSCTIIGLCGGSVSTATASVNRVYNQERVPETANGRWVTMPAGERAGVLTHPAWLAAHGDNFEDDASLVHRGKWIRERLFCESVPGLELVMVQARLGARSPMLSARDRVTAATSTGPDAATCTGCHRLMNSLGLPFEIYNHAGFLRAKDHGHAPDGSSMITNAPDPAINGAVANAVEFAQKIANSPHAKRCFIRQAFRYFMGRDETLGDACALAAMEKALDGGSFFDMLGALVTSDVFLYRTIDAAGGGK